MTFLSSSVLWELSPDGCLLIDGHGTIRASNAALDAMFGVPDETGLVGQSIERLIPDDRRTEHIGLRDGYLRRPQSRSMGESRPLRARHENGDTFPVAVSLTPIEIDGSTFVFAAVRDLTERAQTQRSLDDANRRRDQAEDGERIATELHDNVVQRLFVLGLELQQIDPLLTDTTAQQRVTEAIDTIDETIRQIRHTIAALTAPRPPSLGLRAEVQEIVAQLEGRCGIVPAVTFEGDVERFDPEAYGASIRAVLDGTVDLIAPDPSLGTLSIRLEGGDALLVEVHATGATRPESSIMAELLRLRSSSPKAAVELGHTDGTTTVQWTVAPVS